MSDAAIHTKICNSDLAKKTWRPKFDKEKREIQEISFDEERAIFEQRSAWGMLPEVNILSLHTAETKPTEGRWAKTYPKDLELLFAGTTHLSQFD